MDQTLQDALEAWREKVAALEWGPNHFIGGFGILPDEHMDRLIRLARRGVLANTEDLQRELKWCNHARHGTGVLEVIHSVYPLPKPLAASRRPRLVARPRVASTSASDLAELSEPLGSAVVAPKRIRTITCGACGTKGHNSKHLICIKGLFALLNHSTQSSELILSRTPPGACRCQSDSRRTGFGGSYSCSRDPSPIHAQQLFLSTTTKLCDCVLFSSCILQSSLSIFNIRSSPVNIFVYISKTGFLL